MWETGLAKQDLCAIKLEIQNDALESIQQQLARLDFS